jgi:hypothetical protein
MPAYVGNPLAGDPIWEASSALELRIAITTKQVSRAGHPSDLLVAKRKTYHLVPQPAFAFRPKRDSAAARV